MHPKAGTEIPKSGNALQLSLDRSIKSLPNPTQEVLTDEKREGGQGIRVAEPAIPGLTDEEPKEAPTLQVKSFLIYWHDWSKFSVIR